MKILRAQCIRVIVFSLGVSLCSNFSVQCMAETTLKSVCNIYNPPTTTLLLKVLSSGLLARNFYAAIKDKNLFQGNILGSMDNYGMYVATFVTACSTMLEMKFTRHCERLLYSTRANLSSAEAENIASYAFQLATLDVLLGIGLTVQHANIFWHCAKGIRFKKPIEIEPPCPICKEIPVDPVSPCSYSIKHVFCKGCIEDSFIYSNRCPTCRTTLAQQFPRSMSEVFNRIRMLKGESRRLAICSTIFMVLFFNYFLIQQLRLSTLYQR